ncbi:exocyst complex component EXO70A1-like [Wolffia australiana]
MKVRQGTETLTLRADYLRESLRKSQIVTEAMVSILGSFDQRLSSLETAMRPTQVRTHAIRKAHENIDKTLKSAGLILDQFDFSREAEGKIQIGPRDDLAGYLEAVEQLRKNLSFFSSKQSFKKNAGLINRVNDLLSEAVLKMEEEFKQLLSSYSKPLEPESIFQCLPNNLQPTSDALPNQDDAPSKSISASTHTEHHIKAEGTAIYKLPILIPPRILPTLHDLAEQMVQAGNGQDCVIVYKEMRSPVLEQTLQKLGVEKLGREDVQRLPWEQLEAKIGNWIHFMRIAVKLLFTGEKKVCDQVFQGFDSLNDQCFADVTASSVEILLSLGDAVAKNKRSPEKLFVLLDMYEIMRELQPEIKTLFAGKACSNTRESLLLLTRQLAKTAQETFGDFEEAVEKDVTRTTVADGTVHPLTSYVINYVKFLFDYQSTLDLLFQEFDERDKPENQLANVTMRIMNALQANLDIKSKQYRDPALTHIFLMNNIHYMVRSVRRSEAKNLLGDEWIQRHRRIVQQNASQYRKVSWGKILQTLTIQVSGTMGSGSGMGSDGGSSGVSRTMVKERFKSFNLQFEELHQRQAQWTVPDSELRESLRLSVAEVLLPAYRNFLKRFGPHVESTKNPEKFCKYSPEALEQLLGDFFEGQS